MSADDIAILLIIVAAPPQTAFALIYGFGSPWWRSLLGRALFTKALGMALLIDISLAYHWFGDDYALRDAVRFAVYGFIALGAWLQLGALLHEKARSNGHADRFAADDRDEP